MNTTVESEKNAKTTEAPSAKGKRPPAKNAKPSMKAGRAKTAALKPRADRTNKRSKVIALMNRAKGATLAEIMEVTKWQVHSVRGFVSILGSKGEEKIYSSKSADGERTYLDRQVATNAARSIQRVSASQRGPSGGSTGVGSAPFEDSSHVLQPPR